MLSHIQDVNSLGASHSISWTVHGQILITFVSSVIATILANFLKPSIIVWTIIFLYFFSANAFFLVRHKGIMELSVIPGCIVTEEFLAKNQ